MKEIYLRVFQLSLERFSASCWFFRLGQINVGYYLQRRLKRLTPSIFLYYRVGDFRRSSSFQEAAILKFWALCWEVKKIWTKQEFMDFHPQSICRNYLMPRLFSGLKFSVSFILMLFCIFDLETGFSFWVGLVFSLSLLILSLPTETRASVLLD